MLNATRGTSRRDFFKLTGSLGLAAGFAATLSACGSKKEGEAQGSSNAAASKDGVIKAGISYELGTNGYDPMTTTSALTLAANWHTLEGLTELDPVSTQAYAALGKELPVKVDDTTYEVTLRDGAVFSTGEAVTVDDVVYSFERVLDPANKSLYATFLAFLDSVSAKDESTVVIKLKYAFSLVAERLSVVKIVPKALVDTEDKRKEFDRNPVGTGAYIMTDNGAASQTVLFERNEKYNGPKPALAAKMIWNIMPENTTRTNALTSGTVQAIDAVSATDLTAMKDPNKVAALQGFGLVFMMFNCDASNPMSDVKNRQAILYAVNYDEICTKGMADLATPATCFVQKEHPTYKEASTVYTHDVEKAKSLLAETGLKKVRLLCSDHGWFSQVRPTIKQNLEAAGLEVVFEEKKSSDVYSTIDGNPEAYDVVLAPGDPSVFGQDADLLMRWWYAGDTWTDQRMHWKGSAEYTKVQELLDRAVQVEGDEQLKVWHDLYDYISEVVPLYPLFHRKTPTAYNAQTLVDFKPIAITGLSFVGVGTTLSE